MTKKEMIIKIDNIVEDLKLLQGNYKNLDFAQSGYMKIGYDKQTNVTATGLFYESMQNLLTLKVRILSTITIDELKQ